MPWLTLKRAFTAFDWPTSSALAEATGSSDGETMPPAGGNLLLGMQQRSGLLLDGADTGVEYHAGGDAHDHSSYREIARISSNSVPAIDMTLADAW